MRSAKIFSLFISLFLLLTFAYGCVIAETTISEEEKRSPFELRQGDRVVLLGNSLIQNDLEYGYIEYMLTTRWPERDITFRNLGWTGDTVYGEARSYYTNPPGSYELLIKQLKMANPTVVFVGYGANEAYNGEEGIPKFQNGLHKLLDEIENIGAKAILLSPIPQMSGLSPEELTIRNKNLKLYSSVISQVASKRDLRYVNIFEPFKQLKDTGSLTTDGIHLNESGYYYLASIIEDNLGLTTRNWKVEISRSNRIINTVGPAKILKSSFNKGDIHFTMKKAVLPLPPPKSGTAQKVHSMGFKIDGLQKGCYTLSVGTDDVTTASTGSWRRGLDIEEGVLFRQANELRNLIVNKNKLFFNKYRPTNRTYLVGFRRHEQKQNSKELEQLDLFISRLEGRIFQLRQPRLGMYKISVVR